MVEASHRFWRKLMVPALVAFAAMQSDVRADDDNGESVPLLVWACDEGTRCVEGCASSCVPHSIYFGSRMECAFALDPAEAFKETSGVLSAVDWSQCGSPSNDCYWGPPSCEGKDPATAPECLPSVCTSGTCDATGHCDDSSACFHPEVSRVRWRHPLKNDVISTATIASCTPSIADLYQPLDDDPYQVDHEPVEEFCVFIGATENYIVALSESPAHSPWFDSEKEALSTPDTSKPPYGSCLWHFKTDSQVWRNPIAPECKGHCTDDSAICSSDTDCTGMGATCDEVECELMVASKGGFLGRFDRYPRLDGACSATNKLQCDLRVRDWEVRLRDNSIAAQGGLVLVHEAGGAETVVDHPEGGETRLILAGTSLGYRAAMMDTDIPPKSNGVTLHNQNYESTNSPHIGLDEAFEDEKLERYAIQDPDSKTFYAGYGGSGGAPSGVAAYELETSGSTTTLELNWVFGRGLPEFAQGDQNGCTLDPEEMMASTTNVQFHRTTPVLSGDGEHIFITNRHAAGSDLSGTVLALSTEEPSYSTPEAEHGYVSVSGPLGHPKLVACAQPSAGDGIVAAPASAELACSEVSSIASAGLTPCCWEDDGMGGGYSDSGNFDRIVVLSKAQEVFVYDFCREPGEPESEFAFRKVNPDPMTSATIPNWGSSFAELRVQPSVSKELGTFYFYDNNPSGERFFAYDLLTMDLKWIYDVGNFHDNSGYCKYGIDPGGHDCYLAPVPYVTEIEPMTGGGAEITIDAHHPGGAYLAGLTSGGTDSENRVMGSLGEFSETAPGAYLADLADARWGRVGEEPQGWQEGCFDPGPCTVELTAGDLEAGIDVTVRTRFGKVGTTRVTFTD